jgi:hypothetical protein
MRHLVYNVRYFVVPINSSLLTITSHPPDVTTLVHDDTKCSTLPWRYNRARLHSDLQSPCKSPMKVSICIRRSTVINLHESYIALPKDHLLRGTSQCMEEGTADYDAIPAVVGPRVVLSRLLWGSPSLLYNGYRVFPRGKAPRRGVDHPPISSAEVKETVELYLYSLSVSSWPVLRGT